MGIADVIGVAVVGSWKLGMIWTIYEYQRSSIYILRKCVIDASFHPHYESIHFNTSIDCKFLKVFFVFKYFLQKHCYFANSKADFNARGTLLTTHARTKNGPLEQDDGIEKVYLCMMRVRYWDGGAKLSKGMLSPCSLPIEAFFIRAHTLNIHERAFHIAVHSTVCH